MKYQTLSIIAGTAACNANCPFCISKMTGRNIKCGQINWQNFDKTCRLAQINNITNVIITGKGEPTLYPDQITQFLKHLKNFHFPIIELQTNGLVFDKQKDIYDKYLKLWHQLGLTFISLSVVDYRSSKNRQIYTPGSTSYIDLSKLINRLHKIGYSVRLSCTLIKGYIDSVSRVKQMIITAKNWQIEHLTLRRVAAPHLSADTATKQWTLKHTITPTQLLKIEKHLEKFGYRLVSFDYGGAIYDYQGQNVCFTNALTIKPKTEDIRQIIFFPDGHLRFDWQYRGAILF